MSIDKQMEQQITESSVIAHNKRILHALLLVNPNTTLHVQPVRVVSLKPFDGIH